MSTRASRRSGPASRQAPAARVLYLSYDGMCDPLGGSQVLPYLIGLAKRGHRISLISFEKRVRTAEERAVVGQACVTAGIDWHPLAYHKRPPVVSTLYDLRRMERLAARLHREARFELFHCRSYLPALVGVGMKRRHGVRFLFDMRGFWADERVDGRIWNVANPAFKSVYNYFKRREAEFLREADHIVSLTEAGKQILLGWRRGRAGPPISMIPCCVDFDTFPPVTAEARSAARHALGIAPEARVAVYLGSFGSWYMIEEMLALFRAQLERDPGAIFLVISREPADEIVATATANGVPKDRLVVRSAARADVPKLAAAADYGLFFIQPVFSKKASSPTKMGEFLALELPMVTNGDVGDVARIMAETGAGVVVEGFEERAYRKALEQLERLQPDMERWRKASRRWFDLQNGIDRYDAIYRSLIKSTAEERDRAA